MHSIYEPISGEKGYFCSEIEKTLIDAILIEYSKNQSVLQESSRSARGGVNE